MKHRKREWELLKIPLRQEEESIKKIVQNLQSQQIKQLEAKHDREMKELNAKQAKVSVETAKEIANDKTLKTKAEKDRRLREKQQNNTKKFVDERKFATIKQAKEIDKLKKTHEKQLENLSCDIKKVLFLNFNVF